MRGVLDAYTHDMIQNVGTTSSIIASRLLQVALGQQAVPRHALMLILLLAAVGFELTSGALMKHCKGFRSLKTLGALAVSDACLCATTYWLVNVATLKSVWTFFTQLEYAGMTLVGVALFGERLQPATVFAIALGMLGTLGFDSTDPVKEPQTVFSVSEPCIVAICGAAMLAMLMAYEVSQGRKKTSNPQLLIPLRCSFLFVGVIFEVLTTAVKKMNKPLASILCTWATSACGVVMLEHSSLHCAWAIFTGLEYLLTELVACYFFKESFSLVEVCSVAAVTLSTTILVLADAGYLEPVESLHGAQYRMNDIRQQILTLRQGSGHMVVLIAPIGAGQIVVSELSTDNKPISCVVIVDERPACMFRVLPRQTLAVHWQSTLQEDCLDKVLALGLMPGDIVLDPSNRIPKSSLVTWCQKHCLQARSTYVSQWPAFDNVFSAESEQSNISVKEDATSVSVYCIRPEAVTHCIKKAVLDIGHNLCVSRSTWEGLNEDEQAAAVANEIGICGIDIAQVDTEENYVDHVRHASATTWSCSSFAEAVAQAEFAYHNSAPGKHPTTGQLPSSKSMASNSETHPGKLSAELGDLKVRFIHSPSQMESVADASELGDFRVLGTNVSANLYTSIGVFVRTRGGCGQWRGLKLSASHTWEETHGKLMRIAG